MQTNFMEQMIDVRSKKNSKARIKIMKGHFATTNSHLDTYIDISTVKTRRIHSKETASIFANELISEVSVDTIICLDETAVIGAHLAELLANSNRMSLSYQNNIAVITPEIDRYDRIVFRDNQVRMVKNNRCLILAASTTTGRTLVHAIDVVSEYYGGSVCGVCSIFSAIDTISAAHGKIVDMPVHHAFGQNDVPAYNAYKREDCPMCQSGQRVQAIVNSYGYSICPY